MNIKTELLKAYISDYIESRIEDFVVDADKIANTTAIKALYEIQEIIKSDSYSDFKVVDEIVCVFEKYKLDFGDCHNF